MMVALAMETIDRLAPPPGAVLVRVRASGPEWVDRLPPVPRGETVTVSVSDVSLRAVPAVRLMQSGYRIVGVHPWRAPAEDTGSVDLLITAALIDRAPDWWGAILDHADRAFDLRFGPVQRVLGQELQLHLR